MKNAFILDFPLLLAIMWYRLGIDKRDRTECGGFLKAKIYTKTGDKGQTSLVGGTRVAKTHVRLEAYGTLDELNSVLGLIRSQLSSLADTELRASLESKLQTVQNNLFNIGSHLACESAEMKAHLPGVKAEGLQALEADMDEWERELPPLREFILPGGTTAAGFVHLARTVCRRGERQVVRLSEGASVEADHVIYLNRLSDWLFLLARKLNFSAGEKDITWSKS